MKGFIAVVLSLVPLAVSFARLTVLSVGVIVPVIWDEAIDLFSFSPLAYSILSGKYSINKIYMFSILTCIIN